jgi:hypothetical protein
MNGSGPGLPANTQVVAMNVRFFEQGMSTVSVVLQGLASATPRSGNSC